MAKSTIIQFIRYLFVGGLGTIIHFSIFTFFSLFIFHAISPDEKIVQFIDSNISFQTDMSIRQRNAFINALIAFFISNLFVYLVSQTWIFKSGSSNKSKSRNKKKEIFLFFAFTTLSSLAGGIAIILLIQKNFSTFTAYLGNLICVSIINFLSRKYIIFQS